MTGVYSSKAQRFLFNLPALIFATMFGNALLIVIGKFGIGTPMGDLDFAYQPWAEQVLLGDKLLGISQPWVYPFPALAPMLAASLIAPGDLATGWLVLQASLMLAIVCFIVLYRRQEGATKALRYMACYAWIGYTIALGPVAISRIDYLSVCLAMLGVFMLSLAREKTAAAFFTAGAWIKIWPVAMFAALVIKTKNLRSVILAGASVTAILLVVGYVLGGNENLFSFVTGQGERGLQIEAPVSTPWLWAGVLGATDAGISYNQNLLTFEVFGPNTQLVASLMNLVQFGAVLITLVLGLIARRRGVASLNEVFVWTAITSVCDLIFFNKVGSPQFISWLAVPVIAGLLLGAQRLLPAAIVVLVISLTTWLVYPIVYDDLLGGGAHATAVLAVRNLLMLALLVYANSRLTNLALQKLAK